ncbi:hypothetical protein Tcan_00203 [Toxocara canis]|uniref:G-protein coupled receptors family 1 profile domain-containing protein n=1 Tax=Toxocara canis TaxID=6265 RepID=A0A0B2UR90_TOXCA|nr:hypothetical protein Tcan_00203 [Toxocara canis]
MNESCPDEITPHTMKSKEIEFACVSIAVSFLVASLLLDIFYVFVLKVILSCREWRRKSFYQFIVFIGIFDCIQLTFHFLTGIMHLVFHFNSYIQNYSYYVVKAMGAVHIASWFPNSVATLLLAVDRFIAFVYPWLSPILFSKLLIKLHFLAMIVLFGFICAIMLSPYASFIYDPENFGWDCQQCKPLCKIFSRFDQLSTAICALLTFVIYLLIARRAFQLRGASSISRMSPHEVRLTVQMIVMIIFQLFIVAFWEFDMDVTKQKDMYANAISMTLWMLWNGCNPFIYLLFNKALRKKFVAHCRSLRSILGERIEKISQTDCKINEVFRNSAISSSRKVIFVSQLNNA